MEQPQQQQQPPQQPPPQQQQQSSQKDTTAQKEPGTGPGRRKTVRKGMFAKDCTFLMKTIQRIHTHKQHYSKAANVWFWRCGESGVRFHLCHGRPRHYVYFRNGKLVKVSDRGAKVT